MSIGEIPDALVDNKILCGQIQSFFYTGARE